jgi:hypothetical protein
MCASGKFDFIKKKEVVFAANFLMQHHDLLDAEFVIINFKIFLPDTNESGMPTDVAKAVKTAAESNYVYEQRKETILNLIKFVEDELVADIEKESITKLLLESVKANFVEVTSYLHYMRGETVKSFLIYLTASCGDEIKTKIFKWLDFLLTKYSGSKTHVKKFDEIRDAILVKISDIFRLSIDKAKDLIEKHFIELETQLILGLGSHPEIQIEILEKVLDRRKVGEKFDNELLALHISLLCQSKDPQDRHKIMHNLKTYEYPLETCLQILKQYDAKDAAAFIEEKGGNHSGALEIRIEATKDLLRLAYDNPAKITIEFQRELKSRLTRCNQMLIGTDEERNELTWFWLFGEITKFNKDLIAKSSNRMIYRILRTITDEIIEELLYQIMKWTPITKVFDQIHINYNDTEIGFFKKFLQGALWKSHYELITCGAYRKLVSHHEADLTNQEVHDKEVGTSPENFCQICDYSTNEYDICVFRCNHSYHKTCLKDKICPMCNERDDLRLETILRTLGDTDLTLGAPKKAPPKKKQIEGDGLMIEDASENPIALKAKADKEKRSRILLFFDRNKVVTTNNMFGLEKKFSKRKDSTRSQNIDKFMVKIF